MGQGDRGARPGGLNTDKEAEVDEVSCASAGNCAAEGNYSADHVQQVFVTSERNGRWGKAIAVPGLAALNKRGERRGQRAVVRTCGYLRGRDYYDRSDHDQGFVASARNGVWGRAIAVPGRGPEHGRGRRGLVGIVLSGGHLDGPRVLLGPFRYRYRVHRHPDEIAPSDPLQPRRNQSAQISQATAHLRKIGLMPRILSPLFSLKDLRGPSLIFRRRALAVAEPGARGLCHVVLVQVLVLDWVISFQSRALAAAKRSMWAGLAAWKAGRRAACCSAWGAVWPPEAMRRSIQLAGSVQAAPRVGQAQSISQAQRRD